MVAPESVVQGLEESVRLAISVCNGASAAASSDNGASAVSESTSGTRFVNQVQVMAALESPGVLMRGRCRTRP